MENEIPWFKNIWAWIVILLFSIFLIIAGVKLASVYKKKFIYLDNSKQSKTLHGTENKKFMIKGKTNSNGFVTLLAENGKDTYLPYEKVRANEKGSFEISLKGSSSISEYLVSPSKTAYNEMQKKIYERTEYSKSDLKPTASIEFIPKISSSSKQYSTKSSENSARTNRYHKIDNVFDTSHMMSYTNNELFDKPVKITGNITSLGADNSKQYHILLTGNSSSQKYLIVVNSSKTGKLTEHSNATVYGTITGKGHVNDNQINSGISENYYKDPIILVDADKVS